MTRLLLLAVALAALGACATMRDQLAISTVDGCIKHNCNDAEARDYQSCEASCRRTYGR